MNTLPSSLNAGKQQKRNYDVYYQLFNEMDDGEPETEDLVLVDESIGQHFVDHHHHHHLYSNQHQHSHDQHHPHLGYHHHHHPFSIPRHDDENDATDDDDDDDQDDDYSDDHVHDDDEEQDATYGERRSAAVGGKGKRGRRRIAGVMPMTVDATRGSAPMTASSINAALSSPAAPATSNQLTVPTAAASASPTNSVSRRDCFPTMLYHSGAHVIELPDAKAQCSRCHKVLMNRHTCTQHILYSIRCDGNNRQNWPLCPHCSQHITPSLISDHLSQCQESATATTAAALANGSIRANNASTIGVGDDFEEAYDGGESDDDKDEDEGEEVNDDDDDEEDDEDCYTTTATGKRKRRQSKARKKVHRRGSERIPMHKYLPRKMHSSGAKLIEQTDNTFRCSRCKHVFGLRGAAMRHIKFSVRCDPKNRENWPQCPCCKEAFQPELFGQHVRKCANNNDTASGGNTETGGGRRRGRPQGSKSSRKSSSSSRGKQEELPMEPVNNNDGDDANSTSNETTHESKRRRKATEGAGAGETGQQVEDASLVAQHSLECYKCGQSYISPQALQMHHCSGGTESKIEFPGSS